MALETLRRVADKRLKCALYAVSTVQEEIGLRGARTSTYGIDPRVGIAVDVTHATDCPTMDQRQQGDIKLGHGPVIFRGPNMNPVVVAAAGRDRRIAAVPLSAGRQRPGGPNDARTIQISRSGVATGLVSIPNRYMHSAVETVCLDDIDQAADAVGRIRSRPLAGRRVRALAARVPARPSTG